MLDAGAKRDKRIDELSQQADQWAGKLDAQDEGKKKQGRKLSDGGARAKLYREVCEAHLARIVKVDLKSELFTCNIDEQALKHAKMMDGKLLLVTNAPDFTPAEVVKRYKSLADIERGFRVLKSEIEIGPIYHRLPDRIYAHTSICFTALILYRVMRSRLKDSNTKISPKRALDKLRRIQHRVVKVNDLEPIAGLSSINQEHTEILRALTIKEPTLPAQLPLLQWRVCIAPLYRSTRYGVNCRTRAARLHIPTKPRIQFRQRRYLSGTVPGIADAGAMHSSLRPPFKIFTKNL